MFKEYFKIAIRNLKTRPLRSWLTILGIVIGIFLIMALLSLSQGLKESVLKQLRMIGKDIVVVIPGDIKDFMTIFLGGVELSNEDLKAIEDTEGVETVVPLIFKGETVRYNNENKTVILWGIDWKKHLKIYQEDLGFSLNEGNWPKVGKNEIVAGSLIPKDTFPGLQIDDEVVIEGRKFKVAGILKSLGNKQDDSSISLDLETFRKITGKRKGAQQAMVKIKSNFSIEKVAENIKRNLSRTRKRKRGEEVPSFSVVTSEKATGIISNIMGIIQIVVFGFASIAILVGGIGIMNTMYTSVHERTREIGILKAIGAKSSTITYIFLIEAGIIGLIGGIGGTILGLGFSKLIELYAQFHPIFYLEAAISPSLIIFGFAFSFLVGCLSGFFPAQRASKLNPVDALRYE